MGIKKSKMFNLFNNNVKEAKREKGKRKVRKTPGESDDYLITEAELKDSYINAHTSPLEDLDDSLEESPPLTSFRNLASNPDLAGIKFKKDKKNHDYEDDESESGFSDVLKYVRKDEKKT